MSGSQQSPWQTYVPRIEPHHRHWLTDTGSLTLKLKRHSDQFQVIRTFQGFWRKSFSPILLCVVIEMMFLDISSHSAFFMIFIMYSYTMPRIK